MPPAFSAMLMKPIKSERIPISLRHISTETPAGFDNSIQFQRIGRIGSFANHHPGKNLRLVKKEAFNACYNYSYYNEGRPDSA